MRQPRNKLAERIDPLRASVIAMAHNGYRQGLPLTETASYGPDYEIVSADDALILKIKVPSRRKGDKPRYFTIATRELN